MYLTFKQKFLQQKHLQQTLYGKFGYSQIQPMNQMLQKKKKIQQFPITANIKLRKVTPQYYKSQKITLIDKQIQQIHKQRKRRQQQQYRQLSLSMNNNNNNNNNANNLRQKKSRQSQQNLNKYIIKMNNIISQYNYLIDHKHIKQKNSEQSRKLFNIKPKTQSEKAVEMIEILKKQLLKANINQQVKINKEINQLYKVFKDGIEIGGNGKSHRKRGKSQWNKGDGQTEEKNFKLNMTKMNTNDFVVMSRAMQDSYRVSSTVVEKDKPGKIAQNRTRKGQSFALNMTLGPMLMNQTKHNEPPNNNPKKFPANLNYSYNQMPLKKTHSNIDHYYYHSNKNSKLQSSLAYFQQKQLKKQQKQLQQSKRKQQQIYQVLTQPYVSRKFIQNGKNMDIKIKNNVDAMELWKGRIAEAVVVPKMEEIRNLKMNSINNNNDGNKNKQKEKENYYYNDKNDKNDEDIFYFHIQDKDIPDLDDEDYGLKEHNGQGLQNKNNSYNFVNKKKSQSVYDQKLKNQQQQEIISGLLEKRNCKYMRTWGTKILVKYNATKQAKQMLGLSPNTKNVSSTYDTSKKIEQKNQSHSHRNNNIHGNKLVQNLQQKLKIPSHHNNTNKLSNKNNSPDNKKQYIIENEQQQQMNWDNQIDEEYYWTMCKNQKINLLLKGKRR